MPLAPQRVHHVVIHSEQPYRDLAVPRSDIRRLARYLTNTAIGLVLSGGGARGYGTSMGSFVGGVASGNRGDYVCTRQRVKKGAMTLASIGNILMDWTLPILSMVDIHNSFHC